MDTQEPIELDEYGNPKKPKGSALGAFAHGVQEGALFLPKLVATGIEDVAHNSGMIDDTEGYLHSDKDEREQALQENAERNAEHPFANVAGNIGGAFLDPTNYIPGVGMASVAARTAGKMPGVMLKAAAKDAAINAGYGFAGQAVKDDREFGDSTLEDAGVGALFGAGIAGGGHVLKGIKGKMKDATKPF
jgi:hypothetical protein